MNLSAKCLLFSFLCLFITNTYCQITFEPSYNIASQFRFEQVSYLSIPFNYDNDSDDDILVIGSGEYPFFIYNNMPNGEFIIDTTTIQYSIVNITDIKVVDLDQDNLDDIVLVGNNQSTIAYYQNLGNGEFGTEQIIYQASIQTIQKLKFKDLDNDGRKDLINYKSANSIEWLKNEGDGSFGTSNTIYPQNCHDFQFGDVNNDGSLDLVIARNPEISYFLNNGNGTFGDEVNIINFSSIKYKTIFLEDTDNDNDIDIFFHFSPISTNSTNPPYYTANFYKIEHLGNSTFSNSYTTLFSVPLNLSEISFVDINEDGFKDIVGIENVDDKITWWENNGNNTFLDYSTLFSPAESTRYFNVWDYNNDGELDLLLIGNGYGQVTIHENLGNRVYSKARFLSNVLCFPHDIDYGDLDNDGDLDVLVGGLSKNVVSYFKNIGAAKFSKQHSILHTNTVPATGKSKAVCIKDLDGDGFNDVIHGLEASSFNAYDGKVIWYKNDGLGNFINPIEIISDVRNYIYEIVAIDLDLDGDNDLLIGTGQDVFFYKNDGTGQFDEQILANDYAVFFIEPVDIDNDGTYEILMGSNTINVFDYINDQFVALQNISILNVGSNNKFAIDYDKDGFVDIIGPISNYPTDNGVGWARNLQNGTFAVTETLFIDTINTCVPGDFDNDGDIDIISSYPNINQAILFENFNNDSFSVGQSTPIQFGPIREIRTIDIDNDNDLDIFASYYTGGLTCSQTGFLGGLVVSENLIGDTLTKIEGKAFWDKNNDNVFNGTDEEFKGIAVKLLPDNTTFYTDENGDFTLYTNETGNHTITIESPQLLDCEGFIDFSLNQPSIYPFTFEFQPNITINQNFSYSGTSPNCREISGLVFNDNDNSGNQNNNELGLAGILLTTDEQTSFFSNTNGIYDVYLKNNIDLEISAKLSNYTISHNYCAYDSVFYSQTYPLNEENQILPASINDTTNIDFGVNVDHHGIVDLGIYTLAVYDGNTAGKTFRSYIDFKSTGNFTEACTLKIEHDPLLSLQFSSIPISSSTSNSVEWVFPAGSVPEIYCMPMEWYLDSSAVEGDTLKWKANYECPGLSDICELNNTKIREIPIISGPLRIADENVKLHSMRPEGTMPELIDNKTVLSYIITFQNPLNTIAYDVLVIDTLPSELDLNTISRPFSSFPNYDFRINEDRVMILELNGINLANANQDEINSHGFVQFNISLIEDITVGATIINDATIYFNGIEPSTTNEIRHVLQDFVNPIASCKDSIEVYLGQTGEALILPDMLNDGSSDNIGITSLDVSSETFNCSDIGTQDIQLMVYDAEGNSDFCTSTVQVIDSLQPQLECEDINLTINPNDTISIMEIVSDFDFSDNCSNATITAFPNKFTNQDVGRNSSTITVSDGNGNINTCEINIEVESTTNMFESSLGSSVSLLPNPMHDYSILLFEEVPIFEFDLQMINVNGQIVKEYNNLNQKEMKISKGNLPAGLYFIQLTKSIDKSIQANYKLIIE